jgi:hypothetical protein
MTATIARCRPSLLTTTLACLATLGLSATVRAGETALAAPAASVGRLAGPAGSLILVEASHALPLVRVAVVVRSGSGWDPHKK